MTTDRPKWADDEDLARAIDRAFQGYVLPRTRTAAMPEPRRRRRPLLAFGAAAIALVLAVAVPMATAPPAAFATWVATPSAPDPAIVAAVNRTCNAPLGPNAPIKERAFHDRIASLPLAVVDQRGRAAMLMFAQRDPDGIAINLCLGAVDMQGTYLGGGTGSSLGATEEPANGPVRVVSSTRNTRHGPDFWSLITGGETYTAYGGTVEPGVERVTVERSDGVLVDASVGDGFFAVWWPGDGEATSFAALDEEGNELAKLESGDWSFPK